VEKGSSWIGSDGGGRHACGVCDCRGDWTGRWKAFIIAAVRPLVAVGVRWIVSAQGLASPMKAETHHVSSIFRMGGRKDLWRIFGDRLKKERLAAADSIICVLKLSEEHFSCPAWLFYEIPFLLLYLRVNHEQMHVSLGY